MSTLAEYLVSGSLLFCFRSIDAFASLVSPLRCAYTVSNLARTVRFWNNFN